MANVVRKRCMHMLRKVVPWFSLCFFALFSAGLSAVEQEAEQISSILMLGDSLTAGYGLQEQEAYPQLVQAYFDDKEIPLRVVNAGLSGDTIAGGLERLPWLLQQQPTWVSVALGANDGLRGFPVAKSEEKLRAIITTIREAGVKPLLFGMDLPTNYGEVYRLEFKAMYQRVAEEMAVPLLPFLLENVAMVKGLNQADGIHPNVQGQEILAQNVIKFIEPIVTGKGDGLPKNDGKEQRGDGDE